MIITYYMFDMEHAVNYGVNQAIMIERFARLIRHCKINNQHQHNGKTWTYGTMSTFCTTFPFWSQTQIRRILKQLITQKILLRERRERITWYAFCDEDKFIPACFIRGSK